RGMLRLALYHDGPSAIRYPRGRVKQPMGYSAKESSVSIGKGELLYEGDDIALIAIGNTVSPSLKAAEMLRKEGISPCVVNARFIKPLDQDLILSTASRVKRVVTVEENVLAGGFGSAVLECLNKSGLDNVSVKRIGIEDEFVEHGSQSILRKRYHLDEEGIYKICKLQLAAMPLDQF
ncbi:MAG TPA: transketolase C-terminal domain-containing protein, partial [Thermodesulfovibrionales bacterium]|nr:transketolase C-terminal domain-containing protein [Thermodesulfovibrionales bacterium]